MSFLWGKSKSETDGTRARHVADLVSCFPSIRRPNNDDSSFELSFEIDRKINTLRIWLPSDFPSNKPVLQVVGTAMHPWLDQYKRVSGCEKLTYWNKKTSSLREVVEETLSELRRAPSAIQRPQAGQQPSQRMQREYQPQPHAQSGQQYLQQQQQQQPLRNSYTHAPQQYQQPQQQYMTRPASTSSPQFPSSTIGASDLKTNIPPRPNYGQQQHQPAPSPIHHQQQQQSTFEDRKERPSSERFQISLPVQPTSFPELQTLQVAQLERLLKDEVAMQCHATNLECVETLRSMRDDMCKANAEDARRNLKKREDTRTEEEEILILQNNLRGAATSYKKKLAQYRGQHAQSKEAILSQLHTDLAALDDRTEDLAQHFVNSGEQEVQAFLQEYLQARGAYHKLKVSLKKAS